MITKIEGIVVSEMNYGESSKIINIITKEHGIIGVLAKGCKNMKSELRSVTSKLTFGVFNLYFKKGKLSILKSVDVTNSFMNIKKKLTLISYSIFLLELAEQVIKETENYEVYDLLKESLIKINEGFDFLVISNILKLKYLDFLGVMPIINCCSNCGIKTNIVTISVDSGGYLCKNCLDNSKIVSEKTIKLIRMFYYVDISKITNIDINIVSKYEIDDFLNIYYDKYTGIYLKNRKFIEKLNQINQ